MVELKSISDQLYEHLSASIIEGKIKPGERLIENDLGKQFGISRSPIRECFKILEFEGLITIQPRKGAFVRALTPKDIEDVFPVRIALESLAARLAVPNMSEDKIKSVKDLTIKMDEAITNNDIPSFLRLNYAFHSIFIKASDNKILENILKNLGKGLWLRIAFLYYRFGKGLKYSNVMHKKVVKAFKDKDADAAEKLIAEHIEHAKEKLFKF